MFKWIRQLTGFRWRPTPSTVVPKQYITLSPAQSTLKQCQRADTYNTRLYKKRLRAVERLERLDNGVEYASVKPPEVNNVEKKQKWNMHHTPVSADLQAKSVIAILVRQQTDADLFMPEPHQIIETARELCLPLSDDSPITTMDKALTRRYTFCSDEVLWRTSRKRCRSLDSRNDHASRMQNRSARRAIKKTLIYVPATSRKVIPPPMRNAERRQTLKLRNCPVSAAAQARAVKHLYDLGRRLYIDYEPQDAIAIVSQEKEAEQEREASESSLPTWTEESVMLKHNARKPASHC